MVDDVNESNIALFSAATDSGTLALDLAMTYASTETEAAKSCFGPYKDFMDATSDVWKVVDECRTAVEGAWSETFQVQLGTKCTSDIDCYTGECYIPVSNKGGSSGSSGGQKQKYCKTPDEMEVPNWGAATLTCLIDKSIPELKGRLAIRLKMAGSSTPAELASRFLAEPGMQRSECRGHDNPWNRHTEEECMAPKQCNFDRAISNETQCLNPCQDGDVGCPSYCGQGDWEVSELPFCMPRVQDGADPWSACHSYVNEKRQEWELECQQCNEQCHNIDWSDPEHEPCNCHEVDGPCDYWRREEGAQRECMDDYCGRYCSGGECASLYRWQCIYAGFSFVSSRKEECLSECSAAGGPNPIPPKNCRAVLNPSTATEDACWKLGQGWIELHYADIPNWDWGRGPPPPESCVIKSYEVLDGKPYVPPPPYGPTCLPECESELDSCIENPNCHNYLEAEGKPVFQICEERFELFRESFESCLEQKRNGCSGVGCMRIYRACRISTGLEVDHIFKDVGCAGCDGWWSNRASRELQCAEELSVEQCRWNVLTQSTESQACARECVWEVCDQAFSECQIAGGSLSECNDLTIAMNQCRECNFIHCEDGCSKGACDVIFGSRDEAYRSCAGCDTSAQCNPSSPCYGDSADSSCNWRWAPEFGYSCSILCEESLRMCQEGVRGFCWEPDDTGVSRSEYDMYRADMDACWQANFPATLPEGAIWREIEIETTMTCAAQPLPQNWDCLKCDGEWNSWVVWSADLGPKCIAGTVSFDNGKTVPDTCSNCKPRTCPQYPVNCDARWYDERQCHWNEYNFKICSKSGAEAKATVVAANAECADCQTARCEWSCYDHTCSELMVIMPWDRMAPVEQCGGCPDVARCHPGAECFISDVVAYTQDDLNDWEQFLTLFQPMMDQYVACTGMSLQRRLKEDEAKTPKVQPTKPRKSMATKAERTPQVLKDLENKVTALWRQGNRLRNEGRNKRYQLKQLAEQNVGRTNFQGVIARRNLLEKQHQELQKRYLTLVQNHGEALKKWQNEGGVVTAPPHHPMSSFTEELRTIGSSESRRLQDMPQQVQLACTGSDCATQSGLCDAFFNRGGVAQQLVDTLVSSFSYDLLPWESGDKICQQMAEICYMSLDAAETAIVQGVYDNTFTPPWVDQWCDGWADMANCDASTQCSSCSDLTSAVDYNTCEGCCQCLDDVIGYYARLKHSWSIPEAKCRMLGEYLRKTGKDAWIHYDEKLLGGEGACSMHVDVWQLIPEVCHDPECYQSEECSKQCFRPEATKEMCPSPFTWSFFKSTREWRPGMLATQSTCEVESCYPQPWIPTEAECKTVSHCESDCPYCETDQFWDWEMKKTMVKCSFVNSKTSKPLSEADCKIACGGSFSGTCYFKKDNRSTAAACITDPPTDALGSTTYEKCVGQKALTGASVTSANYELLQCSSFTTEQCGWAQTTFGQDMACTIHRLQCKNRADCKEAGPCDYEWDDWQIQENGGLCVAPNDFSKDTSYSPHRDFWGECSTLGGEHRSYGCMLYQVTSKDACTQAGAKWFPSAHSKSKCEVPGYAWKKMSSGGFYSGTMACCIQLRGSKSEGRCEMFTQDENSTSCEHCGGTWMSIFRFRSHGRWVEGSWQKNYKWTARAFEPSNKWVTRIAFEKVTDVWQNLIAAIRAVPAVNFVTCRIGPTLDTLVAIAKQTAAQSTLGTVPLLPATASATQVGDYVIEPSDNSVTGTTEIDVQVNLLSSGAEVAENAKGNSTNTTGGNRRMRRKRRLAGTGLSDTLTASCYTVVVNAGRYIGQLVGDCIIFSPSTALDNPVKVCLPTNPQIPVYGAFNLDCLVTVSSGVYSVAPMTVTKSTDGLSTCAQLSAPGTYCPGKIFGTGEPDRSAPSGCGSVTAISDTVVTQAAVLKAAGPVSLPGLVKIGETVSSDGFAPQAVYISSSGTVQSVEDFAETAQQITGTNAGGASTTVATTTVATTAGSSTTDESAETTEGEGTTSLDGRESSSTIKLSSNSCLPASMAVAAALLQLVM